MNHIRKLLVLSIIFGVSNAANAGCEHQGVVYDEGATICSGGWLMQCTAAGYWSTIGACHHEHQKDLSWLATKSPVIKTDVAQMPVSRPLFTGGV